MNNILDTKLRAIKPGQYTSLRDAEKIIAKSCVDDILERGDFGQAVDVVKQGIYDHEWLCDAYISYYRGQSLVSLYEVASLDWINIEIFRLICGLRRIKGWSDQTLYELELFAKQVNKN